MTLSGSHSSLALLARTPRSHSSLALLVVTTWRLIVLMSDSGRTPGRIMVFLIFLSALVSNSFGLDPVVTAVDSIAPDISRLFLNIALICVFFSFIYFFSAQLASREVFFRTWLQTVVGLSTAGAMSACWIASPVGIPTFGKIPLHDPGLTPVYLFYTLGGFYFGYACVLVVVLATRAARQANATQPWAFLTCAIGVGLAFLGGPLLRVTSILLQWASAGAIEVPLIIKTVGQATLNLGIVGYIAGLCAIGGRTLVIQLRMNADRRRRYRALQPLWSSLVEAFPSIQFRSAGSIPERLGLRRLQISYRYSRRLIECRDSLWRLSPYVADPPDSYSDPLAIRNQALLVYEALPRVGNTATRDLAEPVAIAASQDGDDRHLVDLAAEFARLDQKRALVRQFEEASEIK
ncbi:MAB_1171c family putative transporter [Pseudonocardia sp. Ae356_Ps1]|uniref:MAB_1171c family putative transporter n=1 Tax=Pseudonocardia sp. Ae356_Ps1 TaxID=1885032 RepID=UPI00352FA76B